jgi:hypothetical protein
MLFHLMDLLTHAERAAHLTVGRETRILRRQAKAPIPIGQQLEMRLELPLPPRLHVDATP